MAVEQTSLPLFYTMQMMPKHQQRCELFALIVPSWSPNALLPILGEKEQSQQKKKKTAARTRLVA